MTIPFFFNQGKSDVGVQPCCEQKLNEPQNDRSVAMCFINPAQDKPPSRKAFRVKEKLLHFALCEIIFNPFSYRLDRSGQVPERK